ncbi:MAG: hypothetical protein JWM27_3093 [Gemmatimonadetes bacterium]|nr:hypothetical protein [Gemmatimonadota bacterium]
MKGDPYWTTARRDDKCAGCREPIKPRERIFYYPANHRAYCARASCGERAAADFNAHVADEGCCCW